MAGCPRVTHPSATKASMSPPKLPQRLPPFDLHVLSTPPAFILSQDQTLMFWSLAKGWTLALPFFTVLLGFLLLNSLIFLLEFQGCIAVCLSRCTGTPPYGACHSCRPLITGDSYILSFRFTVVNAFFLKNFIFFIFFTLAFLCTK